MTKKKYEKQMEGYAIRSISPKVALIDDYTTEAKRKNLIYAMAQTDITDAKRIMDDHYEKTGERISMTAYIVLILARLAAQDEYKFPVNTLRLKKKKFYIFDDVDVSINIERTVDGIKKPVNYTVRKANEKTLRQINDEIREAQSAKKVKISESGKSADKLLSYFPKLPRFMRRLIFRYIFRHPLVKKKLLGTVGVTAVGMLGKIGGRRGGNGYMIHITPHTLSVGVGGIAEKPMNVNGEIMNRTMLDLTLAMDHAIIDGGPATRFFHDLAYGLSDVYLEADWCFKSL